MAICCLKPATRIRCLCSCSLLKALRVSIFADTVRGIFYMIILIFDIASWVRHPEDRYESGGKVIDRTERITSVLLGFLYVLQGVCAAFVFVHTVVLRREGSSTGASYMLVKALFILGNVVIPVTQRLTYCDRKAVRPLNAICEGFF